MRAIGPVLALVLLPSLALAQTPGAIPAPRDVDGRFVLRETPEGFLRMDSRTGQISLCARQSGGLTCRLVPDDRTALEAEVERLKAENEALKRGGATALAKPPTDGTATQLPSDQDIDRALSIAERVWRKFMQIMRDTEQEQPSRRL
ncbi:hypothetical protein E8L99_15665 [Phreatobacter aquaticus]|uniref:Uncharacterized protein n=1 Tax=Phreatobacter aquaticus TaxID=2570229 RepID=A0A4D7QP96_9HYPH|nr:hypothetical protein [Phreatobacter aquaticus]QCK87094.1 hypothetical protein E8L99_15665 [Phreatobacter aquaticus]